jgi:glycerophosphoryl diester phosphodiesterase
MQISRWFFTVICVSCCFASADADETKKYASYPVAAKHGGVYVVAHRGAHKGIPENTLAAYQKAIDLGADFVEIDLRTTKDGQFVSVHNRTIDAYLTDGTTGKVRDFTLTQIKAFDIGSRVGPEWKAERVPTFDEILTLCKGQIGIYLDLKDAPIAAVAKKLQEHNMERHVVWCVGPEQAGPIRKACPDCIPMPDPVPGESLEAMLQETKPTVVAPVWSDFTSTFSETCHNAGAIVIVDERRSDLANWKQALEWKVDGIQTDDPEGLIEYLQERP